MSLTTIIDTIEGVLFRMEGDVPVWQIMSQLKGSLGQVREQLKALESEERAFDTSPEKAALEAEIKKLKTALDSAHSEIQVLRAGLEIKTVQNTEPTDKERDILRFLGTQDFPVTTAFIADKLHQHQVLVQHPLDGLLDREFILFNPEPGEGNNLPTWAIGKKGRAYLGEHNLL